MVKRQNILFVCKFNQTRSQIARALFQKLNKNKDFKTDCVGIIYGKQSRELKNAHNFIFKKHKIKPIKFKFLSKELLNKQTHIIVVADDVPLILFNSQRKSGIKVTHWKARDGHKYKDKTRRQRLERVYQNIHKKIKRFIASIN